jgi:elongation factor 1-delta
LNRFELLETENSNLKKSVAELVSRISKLEARVTSLEGGKSGAKQAPPKAPQKAPEPQTNGGDDDDDDIDLFGSDDNDNGEADKAREKRLQDYAAKKAKKPGPIAKSSVVLDVKPWDDETDLKEMEKVVRSIQMDGLVWGASKFQPIAYNIKKLQIVCVVEDEKVGIEDLSEKIQEFEDYVQSVDIAAFNKI